MYRLRMRYPRLTRNYGNAPISIIACTLQQLLIMLSQLQESEHVLEVEPFRLLMWLFYRFFMRANRTLCWHWFYYFHLIWMRVLLWVYFLCRFLHKNDGRANRPCVVCTEQRIRVVLSPRLASPCFASPPCAAICTTNRLVWRVFAYSFSVVAVKLICLNGSQT